jgi:hypothetical protein
MSLLAADCLNGRNSWPLTYSHVWPPLTSEVKVKVMLRPTASWPVSLGVNPPYLGPKTGFLLLSDSFGFIDVGRLL